MERRGKKDNFLSRSSPTGLKPNSNPQKKSKKIRLSEISTPKRKKGSRRRSKSPPPSLVRFNSLNMAKVFFFFFSPSFLFLVGWWVLRENPYNFLV